MPFEPLNLVYKEVQPPTGIEHAVCAHFTSTDRWNLIVARTSTLTVYSIHETKVSTLLSIAIYMSPLLPGTRPLNVDVCVLCVGWEQTNFCRRVLSLW
jgi:hypothetical protein